jgi:hypothetical protein
MYMLTVSTFLKFIERNRDFNVWIVLILRDMKIVLDLKKINFENFSSSDKARFLHTSVTRYKYYFATFLIMRVI